MTLRSRNQRYRHLRCQRNNDNATTICIGTAEIVGIGIVPSATRTLLLLLQVTHPATPADDPAQLSIGRRDALLLRVRESLFGPKFSSQAVCPHCGEQLEVNFDVASILIDEPVSEDAHGVWISKVTKSYSGSRTLAIWSP